MIVDIDVLLLDALLLAYVISMIGPPTAQHPQRSHPHNLATPTLPSGKNADPPTFAYFAFRHEGKDVRWGMGSGETSGEVRRSAMALSSPRSIPNDVPSALSGPNTAC